MFDIKGDVEFKFKVNNKDVIFVGFDDFDFDDILDCNFEVFCYEGEWYWFMKVEFEMRFENGIDVRFFIDDLWVKIKLEGWDGICVYVGMYVYWFYEKDGE